MPVATHAVIIVGLVLAALVSVALAAMPTRKTHSLRVVAAALLDPAQILMTSVSLKGIMHAVVG
jgi:hypothetical protein